MIVGTGVGDPVGLLLGNGDGSFGGIDTDTVSIAMSLGRGGVVGVGVGVK